MANIIHELGVFLTSPYVQLAAFAFVLFLGGIAWAFAATDNRKKEIEAIERRTKALTSGVYKIEYIDADTVMLTRKE